MTEGTAPEPPSVFPVDHDPSHPLYGFQIDKWLDHPTTHGPDWFPTEERYRRDASAHAYRQRGTKENWHRYLILGFFVFEDCNECDKVWAAIETDPLQVHRSIWYNFTFHVDHEIDIPPKLHAWAMNVSQAYLVQNDPKILHEMDTLQYSWKKMPFRNSSREIEDQSEWIPVTRHRRSKSPPKDTKEVDLTVDEGLGSVAPGFNLPPDDTPKRLPITPLLKNTTKQNPPKQMRSQHISWSPG
jgi:hypothetical protein